ncbi:MAG TPA: hypothetical protein VM425_07105 [Myxococcota bacterium]|nr:hypothetical protein [Myxococcota bacterium]
MSDMRHANSGILDEPIKVKKRRRVRHPWLWLFFAMALLVGLVLVRVALISFPAFSQAALRVGDGLQVLRGAYHLRVTDESDSDKTAAAIDAAFRSGMDFVVLVDSNIERAGKQATHAPLSVVVAQEISTPMGTLAAIRPREAGAWSVIEHPAGGDDGWKDWDTIGYQAMEFYNVDDQLAMMHFWDRLGHWAGDLLGTPYAWVYLGLRPTAGLARWDYVNRRARITGLCGLGTASADESLFRAMATYLLVGEGLGPYGPPEVERALEAGHHYCALSAFGDFSGFRFVAKGAGSMGDRVSLAPGLRLDFDLHLPEDPGNLTLYLYQDGHLLFSAHGTRGAYDVHSPGAYRVEVGTRFPNLPWGDSERRVLFSNPIFIVEPG